MKTLIFGAGNLLLSDEGFGVHCIRHLEENYMFPDNVELYDGGTLGIMVMHKFEEAERIKVLELSSQAHDREQFIRSVVDGLHEGVLALDATGRIVGATKSLDYMVWNGTAWRTEAIHTTTASELELHVDGFGVPRVAWIDASSQSVRLATRLNGAWVNEVVTTSNAAHIDLEVGPTGTLAVGMVRAGATTGFSIFR